MLLLHLSLIRLNYSQPIGKKEVNKLMSKTRIPSNKIEPTHQVTVSSAAAIQKSFSGELSILLDHFPHKLRFEKEENSEKKGFFYRKNYLSHLNECACYSQFNRSKYPRREQIEQRIISGIHARFPLKQKLNYLSLGAGGLLQDFVICANLILKGYSLQINLIEPEKDKQSFIEALKDFKQLMHIAAEKNTTLTVHCFSNIIDYIKEYPDEKINVASAIDFIFPIRNFNDLLLTHQTLDNNGIFYLSLHKHDYLFDKTSCIFSKTYDPWWKILNPTDHSQSEHIPAINARIARGERIIKYVTPLKDNYIIKNILLYSGLFQQREQAINVNHEIPMDNPALLI